MVKAVFFDFGGTLDTNGIHWYELYKMAFRNAGKEIEDNLFLQAYDYSLKNANNYISKDTSFDDTIKVKTQLIYDFINLSSSNLNPSDYNLLMEKISKFCLDVVQKNAIFSKAALKTLSYDYKISVVSNFSGNLDKCLDYLGLKEYINLVVDSTIIKIKKPDPSIYNYACSALNVYPYEVIMVGDSYYNDILPSYKIGMKTIWLKGKSYEIVENSDAAMYIISELIKTLDIINNIKCV